MNIVWKDWDLVISASQVRHRMIVSSQSSQQLQGTCRVMAVEVGSLPSWSKAVCTV